MDNKSETSCDEQCEERDSDLPRAKWKRKYKRESLADRQGVEKQKNNRKNK